MSMNFDKIFIKIAYEIQKKYPAISVYITYDNNDDEYFVSIEDTNIYHSEDYQELILHILNNLLWPKKIFNVYFDIGPRKNSAFEIKEIKSKVFSAVDITPIYQAIQAVDFSSMYKASSIVSEMARLDVQSFTNAISAIDISVVSQALESINAQIERTFAVVENVYARIKTTEEEKIIKDYRKQTSLGRQKVTLSSEYFALAA